MLSCALQLSGELRYRPVDLDRRRLRHALKQLNRSVTRRAPKPAIPQVLIGCRPDGIERVYRRERR